MTSDDQPAISGQQRPRLAWFSPLPPVRSGIAAYSAELLPRLSDSFAIDSYPEHAAHDFVWRMRRAPYDLVVYQLGNAMCHDYMWAYLARYPGLVVLHDAKLHHARARQLLQKQRADDYRREFRWDHPEANADFVEYAIQGLGGPIYYFWSMLRPVVRTARRVAVHSSPVADELAASFPGTRIDVIRMGVAALTASREGRAAVRKAWKLPDDAFVFAAFGKVTPEKRVGAIVRALGALNDERRAAYLLLVGDTSGYPSLQAEIAASGVADRVRVTGYAADDAIADDLAAADACLCLRWPTAQESSASWLRCLAAGRPTVISDLAHLADVPAEVALRVDLIDEERTLLAAMRQLLDDPPARERIARAGHAFWAERHTLDAMADDYKRVLPEAIASAQPEVTDLPTHFTADYSGLAKEIVRKFGVDVDLF